MVNIGKINHLTIVKEVDFGMYLDGGEDFGEILLPLRYITPACIVGESVDVFIYLDSEDRIIATTDFPLAMVDDFALLEVVDTAPMGAFVDWGLAKDLLIPFAEQKADLRIGEKVIVKIYLDEMTERITGSTKVDRFLDQIPHEFETDQEVGLMVYSKTDLGYKVIINNEFWGLLYENEVFKPIQRGDFIKGYIKQVREDEKIDVYLQKAGYWNIDNVTKSVLDKLKSQAGYMEVTDKSSPDTIKHIFGISKKSFKKAIGSLYKEKIITIEDKGIRLL
ncbi:GntR family transcriptional regulator [Putridiphycobacter roseus]|uniref:GntR family transcriptional regulator n=1 Tax=Putridiphycobacter roseus TaxID=2219161 RepID=A0A2W1MVJ2_9FLAO|nr:S1-like domain-containing RNA-binding protein [Putridiphycobacter roseus]PZE16119.1 GntR family transcriptional regulator [Putridiphycobacter roseus]